MIGREWLCMQETQLAAGQSPALAQQLCRPLPPAAWPEVQQAHTAWPPPAELRPHPPPATLPRQRLRTAQLCQCH